MQRLETTFAGRKLIVETGRMAKQAAGSAMVQFGDTMVLAAVTVSDAQSPLPFFPLTVEYREKAYAAGKIPGGFIKREARPHDAEILSARIVDRSIRPLFPEGFKNEVQVFIYVISADDVVASLTVAQQGIRELIAYQNELMHDATVQKMQWTKEEIPEGLATK